MLIIKEQQIDFFLKQLGKEFDVFDCRNEVLPFKKYFLPAIQEIFSRNPMSKSSTSDFNITKPPKKFILFGLNLPDLEALTQLDEIMKKPNEDFFYFQKRKQSIVIGLIQEEVDVAPGGDIIFQDLGDGSYKIWLNTKKSKNLIEKNKGFFEEPETPSVDKKTLGVKKVPRPPQIPQNESLGEWERAMRKLLLDSELLADAVDWSRGHKIWDDLAEKCLGCGICTYVCPLCYCFSIEDRVGLDDKCTRCRRWAACTLPEFSRIAGGHTFRPTIKERYYNWFYHKFVRAYKEYGKSQCVGCGRCKKLCPAEIDIQEVLRIILEDYKKSR